MSRGFKSRARNHLQANRQLEFHVEVTLSSQGGDALIITHLEVGVSAWLSAEVAYATNVTVSSSGARPVRG